MPGPLEISAQLSPATFSKDSIDGTAEVTHQFEDDKGILKSQEYFHSLIQAEVDAGIASDRIVLGGFSQGGAISIFSGLTAKVKLAAIVSLSGYLLLSSKLKDLVPQPEFNKETPICEIFCPSPLSPFPLSSA